MKISIIVPVFNTEEFLEDCLLSLVNQTLKEIEIILTVDETSSDSSLDIAREFEAQYPEKIKVIVHPKGLPGDSRNYGLEVAKGEYIGFVDSDDTVIDIMFEMLFNQAMETQADVVCCDIEYCYVDGSTKLRKINTTSGMSAIDNPPILKEATCYVWNKIFKRTLIDQYCFRFPAGRWYEDSAIVYNIMLAANKIECVNIPLYEYKVRRAGGTAHLIDNRVFDVLLSAKDIVSFFIDQNFFEGSMVETAYELCRTHTDVRFNFLNNTQDNELKVKFINDTFDFYDTYFPGWIAYHKPENPEINALAYAKINRDFALKYFCNQKEQASYDTLNELNKKSRNEQYIASLDTPIDETAILYEAYEGTGMNCNPYALFLVAMNDEKLKNYQHIWSIADWKVIAKLEKEWKDSPNVSFVLRGSKDYFEALSGVKYLINNHSFPPYFSKKEGQVLVTSWHAITVKTIGFDFPMGKLESWNQTRIYLQTDWFIAANDFMKNNLATAYKMQNIFNGKVIVEGYPRNDFFVNSNRNRMVRQLLECGVKVEENKEIILYAPTWKGEKYSSPEIDLDRLNTEIELIREKIDLNRYQILIKPHQIVYRNLTNYEKKCGKYIPPNLETNELLSIVDILISDYSSIFVDFMCTKRPVLFYLPDLNTYSDYRGIYFEIDDLPGPTTDKIEDIASYINNIEEIKQTYSERYQSFYNLMFKDIHIGDASQRIVDCIFHGNHQKYKIEELKGEKKKVLVYPGNLCNVTARNRVSEFLSSIDFSLFDITMLVDYHTHPDVVAFIMQLSGNVRYLSTGIGLPKTKLESKALSMLEKGRALSKEVKNQLENMFYREFRRRFGDTEFDATIDLEPENVFQFHLLSQAKTAVQIIWPIDCRQSKNIFVQMKKRIAGSNGFMRYFATGPDVCKTINYPCDVMPIKIENFISNEMLELNNELKPVVIDQNTSFKISPNLFNENTLSMQVIPANDENCYKFVSFSRLVNGGFNDNILRAFKLISNQFENTILYIVADGARFHQVKKLAAELEIDQKVQIINNCNEALKNCYIKMCDCVIEVPSSKEQFSLRTVRIAQSFKKNILMLKFEDDVFAPDEERFKQIQSNILTVQSGMISMYQAMKTIILKRDKCVQAFKQETFNNTINQTLYHIITNPVEISPETKKPLVKRAYSKARRMLAKTKRVVKNIINS